MSEKDQPEPNLDAAVNADDGWFVAVEKRTMRERLKSRDKSRSERMVILSALGDTLAVGCGLLVAFWLRFHTWINQLGVRDDVVLRDYLGYLVFGLATLVGTLASFGIYHRGVLLRYRFVVGQMVKATVVWSVGFLALALFFRFQPPISRNYAIIATVVVLLFLLGWRRIFHAYLGRSKVAFDLRQRVVFIGWNEDAARLANGFMAESGSAYEVLGCIEPMWTTFDQTLPVRILGGYGDFAEILEREGADIAVLSDVECVMSEIVALANACERQLVEFKMIPSYFQILVSGLHLETFSGVPVLGVSDLPLDRFHNNLVKRIFDLLGALVGLTLSVPILIVCGLLVWMESPGPIFFGQERVGRRGQPFKMWKLRTMRVGAESEDHRQVSTTENDPRVLRVGRWMRRWNLDEVPQFWNVLAGQMSLVGPRPERLYHSTRLRDLVPHYNARYNATPGMTGWAQIKGLRGDTCLEERIKCDLWYLENWNVFLDFQIMLVTIWKSRGV